MGFISAFKVLIAQEKDETAYVHETRGVWNYQSHFFCHRDGPSMLQISIACPHIPVRNINFEIFLHTCAQN